MRCGIGVSPARTLVLARVQDCERVGVPLDRASLEIPDRKRRHSHVGDKSPAAVEDVPSNLARCLRKRAKSKPLTLQRRKKEHSAANAA